VIGQASGKGCLTLDQALEIATKHAAAVCLGEDPAAQRDADREKQANTRTVRELAHAYIETDIRVLEIKQRTLEFYATILRRSIIPAIGDRDIETVDVADVRKLMASQRSAGLSAARANATARTISALWAWGRTVGAIPETTKSPSAGIKLKGEVKRERMLSTEELGRLGAALYKLSEASTLHPHDAAAVRLLLFSGARLREVLSLTWSEVDLERGMIRLRTSKTGAKVIPLAAPALAVLAELRTTAERTATDLSRPMPNEVFPARRAGKGVARADLKKPWTAIISEAGLEGLRIHDLRHAFASVGASANLSLITIGKLLGHSQASTTARYAHLSVDPARAAADVIAGEIAAKLDGQTGEVIPFSKQSRP
jgi:integrase